MTQKDYGLIKNRMEKSANLYKLCLEKALSDTTMGLITHIAKVNTTTEREQRYRTIGKITDIISISETEKEFLEKLKTEFPEVF